MDHFSRPLSSLAAAPGRHGDVAATTWLAGWLAIALCRRDSGRGGDHAVIGRPGVGSVETSALLFNMPTFILGLGRPAA
jgi:hypothetical protein